MNIYRQQKEKLSRRIALKLSDPHKIVILAPIIFILHVAEEFPGLVEWMNSLIDRDITQGIFVGVNFAGLLITTLLSVFMATTKDDIAIVLMLAWLSFVMFANSLFHLTATVVHGYSPGAITSLFLYLPYFAWFLWSVIKSKQFNSITIAVTIAIGSMPMFIHGYLIIFEGTRLF